MSLKQQTFQGVKWQVGINLLSKVISFATTIILARHLGPSVFGMFALTLLIVSSFELFKSMGIDSALLRRKDDFKVAANTAFMIIPVLGIVLYAVLYFSTNLIGKLLNNLELIPAIRILGIVFVMNSFTKVPSAFLEKNMKFKEISICDFTATILFSISAIILTFLNFGVWSLVYAYIIKTFISMIMIWVYAKYKPSFEFNTKIAKEMINFGKFVLFSAIIWFLKMNLDNLLVGKLLGVIMLGFYAIAFNIANFGSDYIGIKVSRVIYPAFTKFQDNLPALRSAFLKTLSFISIIALPLGIGIFILGDEFVKLAYGQKWIGAISVLKILTWAGIFNTLPVGMNAIFLTCGKPKLSFWTDALQVSIFFIFIIPMSKLFGVNGVGIVVSISSFIAFLIALIWAKKILSISLKQIYLSLKPSIISTFVMGLVILILKNTLLQFKMIALPHFNFIILFPFALIIYFLSMLSFEKKIFNEIKGALF